MHAKTIKNNVHLRAVMGRAINKIFHGIKKYKIKSCLIYLLELKRRCRQFTEEKS